MDELIRRIEADIGRDRLLLPGLPEVAFEARRLAQDPDAGITDMARAVERDEVLSTRVIEVANTALFRRHDRARSVEDALQRLGARHLETLATGQIILRMFAVVHGTPGRLLRAYHQRTVDVAAHCYALTPVAPHIDKHTALMAGLVHAIGVTPILRQISQTVASELNEADMEQLVLDYHPRVGAVLLQRWGFDDAMIQAAQGHQEVLREGTGQPELVDLVIASNVFLYGDPTDRGASRNPDEVPACVKLGFESWPEMLAFFDSNLRVASAREMLS